MSAEENPRIMAAKPLKALDTAKLNGLTFGVTAANEEDRPGVVSKSDRGSRPSNTSICATMVAVDNSGSCNTRSLPVSTLACAKRTPGSGSSSDSNSRLRDGDL